MKILSGVQSADSGNILLKGQPFAPLNPAQAAKFGVVTVLPVNGCRGYSGFNCGRCAFAQSLCRWPSGVFLSRKSVRREAARILSDAGFDLPLDRDFADLGAADRQMVAIARALANKAELLILDEPTASLSTQEAERLYAILLGLKARGIAILYISHRTADLAALADRVVILRGGRNVGAFSRPIDFDAALETMIGRALNTARPDRRTEFGKTVLDLRGVRLLHGSKPLI